MKLYRILAAATALVVLVLSAVGQGTAADLVVLKNGDRISGTLVKVEKGVATLKTVYAERLEIAAEAVRSLATDTSVEVRTTGGEVLSGPLHGEEGAIRVLGGPGREPVRLDWARVASINVPPPPASSWSGTLFIGAFEQSGNTDRTSVSFGGETVRKSASDRFNLALLYNYATEDGALVTRDSYGAIKYDYFFTEKFYGYLGIEMLKDRFKDLNLRTIVGPGAGYQFWDDELSSLAFEAGLAYFSEDRIEAVDDQWLTARLGARFRYQLHEKTTFTDQLVLYPNLETGGEFSSRNEAALTTTIAGPWSLRLANIWERDSDPSAGIKKDDVKTSVNLQYAF